MLTVCRHRCNAREEIIAHGYVSSLRDLRYAPWPPRKPIGDLVFRESSSLACIRFAFPTPYVDRFLLDELIAQIDEILAHLRKEGFEP